MSRRRALDQREAAVTAREHAAAAREADVARERAELHEPSLRRWIGRVTLLAAVVAALGSWGGPVLQAVVEDGLADEPKLVRCLPRDAVLAPARPDEAAR